MNSYCANCRFGTEREDIEAILNHHDRLRHLELAGESIDEHFKNRSFKEVLCRRFPDFKVKALSDWCGEHQPTANLDNEGESNE